VSGGPRHRLRPRLEGHRQSREHDRGHRGATHMLGARGGLGAPGAPSMDEATLRERIGEVARGRLSRRRFIREVVGLGLHRAPRRPAPAACATGGGAGARAPRGGGALRMLYWQAPTSSIRTLATGVKDVHAARHLLRAAGRLRSRRHPRPQLAAEIPSRTMAASRPMAPGCAGGSSAV
jgi:hypothetical protein